MILPIVAYGDSVLRKVGKEIDSNYPELKQLLANMKATMENAQGVGLAAPQIGRAIRLFLIDASPFAEDEDLPQEERNILKDFKHVFINAKILKEEGKFFKSSILKKLNTMKNKPIKSSIMALISQFL